MRAVAGGLSRGESRPRRASPGTARTICPAYGATAGVFAEFDVGWELGRLGGRPERVPQRGKPTPVRRVARRAGITKPVGPHTLRHAFITAALDAGVPLRDVQEAASHADSRTTMRYDRARVSLDRHATYIVAAYLAGAAR